MTLMTPRRLLLTVCASALVLAGVAGAEGTALQGSVGPGFTISLVDGSGAAVKQLDPGTFSLTVDDMADEHSFHLQGPGGVDVKTEIETVGRKTFALTLVDGKYTFFCDPHPTRMTGTFTVGTTPVGSPPPPAAAPIRLVLTLTSRAVGLTTPAGKPVKALPAGPVVITVRDRSATRGIRLRGAGVNRTTGVPFVGTLTWKVRLSSGTLVYTSDARKPVLRGGTAVVS
jgi:hypothetical protein